MRSKDLSGTRTDGRAFLGIADQTRRTILERLIAGEASAGDLAVGFKITRAGIYKHLRVLREADLVHKEPRGRYRVYRLNPAAVSQIDSWIQLFRSL